MSTEYPTFSVSAAPTVVPVVLPPSGDLSSSGKIRNLMVRGADHSGWLEWAGEGHGWQLRKAMEKQGYALLEDLYRAEDNADGWHSYQRYLKDWQKGRTRQSFPLHLLPREVQARQRGDVGPEHKDPWNLPAPVPTTGAAVEAKQKKGQAA